MNKCQTMQFQELFSEFDYHFSFLNDAVIFRSIQDETYCIEQRACKRENKYDHNDYFHQVVE